MTIYDKAGKVIATSDPPDTRIFDKMSIQNAFLAGMELEGISFNESDLQNSDLSGADLYGASLSETNCDSCRFVNADLRFGFLYQASFRNADLTGARFGLDELGGGLRLIGVDFTNAILDGADFTGATYDSGTIFPHGFDPAQRGLILKE